MTEETTESDLRACCRSREGQAHRDYCAVRQPEPVFRGDTITIPVAPIRDDTSFTEGSVGDFIDYRAKVYGDAVECWTRIAEVWSGILGVHINATDAVLCMQGMKLVRTQYAPDYSDNSDDIEGYLDIFRKVVGEDMVHARSVDEYIEKKVER